jgi:hypothetical protein
VAHRVYNGIESPKERHKEPRPLERLVIRAYRVSAHGMDGITFAKNRANAKYHCFRSTNAVGYRTKFSDIKAKRAPEYDSRRDKSENLLIVGPCYVPTIFNG